MNSKKYKSNLIELMISNFTLTVPNLFQVVMIPHFKYGIQTHLQKLQQ